MCTYFDVFLFFLLQSDRFGCIHFQLHFGIVSGAIKRVFTPDCTMVGIGGRESYGQVLPNDCTLRPGGPDGFTLEWTYGAGMQISEGLAVLEAQVKLVYSSYSGMPNLFNNFTIALFSLTTRTPYSYRLGPHIDTPTSASCQHRRYDRSSFRIISAAGVVFVCKKA